MGLITARLTVFFEDPFYVALYERTENGMTRVCRVVFGAEPKDNEVYDYFLENWSRLKFSPPVPAGTLPQEHKNPKRVQRDIIKQLTKPAVGTKSQQALKLQQEQAKIMRKENRKRRTEEELARKFDLRMQKKKEKHRGR